MGEAEWGSGALGVNCTLPSIFLTLWLVEDMDVFMNTEAGNEIHCYFL